jgi:chaperonin GroES
MEAESKTASGLSSPDSQRGETPEGHRRGRWSRNQDETMQVKVGDVVLYGKYAGTELSVDGKDYLMMRQSDI